MMDVDHRSPLESIFGIIGGLPQGHDKPVKHALYNACALLLLFLCCAATWALFMILEPFVKPLMWAVLVGSALHPLKRSLRDKFHAWFHALEVSNTPVVLAVVLLPIDIFNDLSEFIGDRLLKRIKYIVAVCVAIPTFLLLYHYTPRVIICLLYKAYFNSFVVLGFLIENATWTTVSIIVLGYITLTFLLWKPENNTKFHYGSIVIWLLLSCCLAQQFGSLKMPVFILLQIILFGGFASEVYNTYKTLNMAGHPTTILESMSLVFHDHPSDKTGVLTDKSEEELLEKTNAEQETVKSDLPEAGDRVECKNPFNLELFDETPADTKPNVVITNQGIVIQKQSVKKPPPYKRSFSQPQFFSGSRLKGRTSLLDITRKLSVSTSNQNLLIGDNYGSGFYLYCVLWACAIMIMWKNLFLLPLLSIPIVFYLIKHAGHYFGLWPWLRKHCYTLAGKFANWCTERHDALVPVPIRGLYHVTHKLNLILKATIKDSIDTVASCVVISALIVVLICGSVFIVFQIYAETIMMVQITGNVINQAVVDNPELRQMLPPAWDETVDSILDNAYQYGREGISKAVRSMMVEGDAAKSNKLETQVLELWDRLYQSWMSSNVSTGPKVTPDAVRMSWDNFLSDLQKSQVFSADLFNLSGLLDFAKQNIGTLMSVLESIWSLVKGNIGLLLSSISAFLSVILGGGTAVLNFILNGIVFLTTLFYLLSSSGDLYKPVELMTNFSTSGRRCGHALEAAINGVFTASFKMASFYGLWTWFIHNLFAVKIVYLPTTFATILGAVPFLGTYWACIPGILDLWLAQERGIAAIVFAIFQFLPTSIVDTTIYKEIKGGHPYLTGLAIAGGIFCLGVEGAIIGPLLLCGLYVAIDLSSNLFKESPSAESINLRLQLQDG